MSNKCFITKYPTSVGNDSLPRYKEIDFKAVASDSVNGSLNFVFNSPIGMRFDNPVIYNGSNVTEITKDDGGQVSLVIPKGTTVKGYAKSKYGLTILHTNNVQGAGQLSDFTINIDDLKYSQITYFIINAGKTYGDLSSLSDKTNMTHLMLNTPNITGKLSDLGNLTKLSTLGITNTNIQGTVEDFVVAQRAAGRPTGKITNDWNLGQVTFAGVRVAGGVGIVISWDNTTITVANTGNSALDKTITA